MGNTRNWTREFNARQRELAAFVKGKAGRSEKARRQAVEAAASGRPSDIRQHALEALRERRVQRSLALLSGEMA